MKKFLWKNKLKTKIFGKIREIQNKKIFKKRTKKFWKKLKKQKTNKNNFEKMKTKNFWKFQKKILKNQKHDKIFVRKNKLKNIFFKNSINGNEKFLEKS